MQAVWMSQDREGEAKLGKVGGERTQNSGGSQ